MPFPTPGLPRHSLPRFRLRRALFAAALLASACAAPRPLTPVSAGALAARLANDRCQQRYGLRPFAPDDFEAVWDRGRWHWGSADAGPIDGYGADVSFDARGGGRRVDVSPPP